VGVTALNLCFLPWALGAMHPWSQLSSLALSAAGFSLALLPRAWVPDSSTAVRPAGRLLRFPAFWCGLVLLGYVAAQGFNPAWRFMSDGRSWWLVPVPHISWLPAGVDAPYSRSNPWRALTIFGSLWLLLCSVWSGFRRRRSWRMLFGVLVGNAFLVALLGFLQQLTGAKRIFWSYLPSNDYFSASFIYRNHAGAYFNLMAALAGGLAWWHYRRSQRRLEGPGPAVAFAFSALWIGAMVIFSNSRAATGLLLAFASLLGASIAVRQFRRRDSERGWREFAVIGLALAVFFGIAFAALSTGRVWERFAQLGADPGASLRSRALVRRAAGEMRRDRWILGWGAGCFRYGFPLYAQKYPEIYYSGPHNLKYWEHAHDDLLEYPVELGAAGLLPPAVILAWSAARLLRLRFWRHPVPFCAVLGCLLTLAHAWVDFVFQNPAVLLSWGVLLAGSIRWAELEPAAVRIRPARRSAAPGPAG
jgi:hypothetical protein